MTTATLSSNHFSPIRVTDTAASDDAKRIRGQERDYLNSNIVSFIRSHIERAQFDLFELLEEASIDNWDGEGSAPIDPDTADEAFKFLNSLPSWLPLPEIVPERDGGLAFEWSSPDKGTMLISLNGSNMLIYAVLYKNGEKMHGKKRFNNSLPRFLIEAAKKAI